MIKAILKMHIYPAIILTLALLVIQLKAAGISITLDSADGSSAFIVSDSGNAPCTEINSNRSMLIENTLEVQGAGNSLIAGNLGIGVSTPIEKLEINGALRIENATGTENGTIQWTGTDFEARKSGAWVSLTQACDFMNNGENGEADRSLGNTDNYDLGFKTNNLTRLHIENNGNIGIGTVNPSSSLEISGNAFISKDLTVKGGLRLDSAGISCTTAEMLIVDGKIGIGVANPSYALEVNGTAEATAFSGNGSQLTDINLDYPTWAVLWHDESTVISGASLYREWDFEQYYGTYTYNFPPSNGDSFYQKFYLEKGTYEFLVLGVIYDCNGKIDWYIDDVLKVSGQDWYAAAFTANHVEEETITINTSGVHTLKGIVNGKNAFSSDYFMALTKIVFRKN